MGQFCAALILAIGLEYCPQAFCYKNSNGPLDSVKARVLCSFLRPVPLLRMRGYPHQTGISLSRPFLCIVSWRPVPSVTQISRIVAASSICAISGFRSDIIIEYLSCFPLYLNVCHSLYANTMFVFSALQPFWLYFPQPCRWALASSFEVPR